MLLASIIAVSVLIIENIIFINNNASDPLNCSECKVSVLNTENQNSTTQEPFIGNIGNQLTEIYNKVINKILPNDLNKNNETSEQLTTKTIDSDNFEYKCVRVPKNSSSTVEHVTVPAHLFDATQSGEPDTFNNGSNLTNNNITEGFENFMEVQQQKNIELSSQLPVIDNFATSTPTPVSLPLVLPLPETQLTSVNDKNDKPINNDNNNNDKVASEDVSYSANYVQYQQDGLQQKANEQSEETNKFRREIADQDAVTPWTNEGYKYYSDIFTRSVGAPPANQALTNELQYGDYNYIGPINKGMINKEYTFVSPSNWYPIPPHPPVCVTNKSCTTCPVQISNGKDYMNWASWQDFDKARRFTGDMNINVDYVKNVLNNSNGF
jgi:hypothetical protein